jgi:hypothetical protein
MKRVSVSVQDDYLERMSKTRPINAVAELVWNSLDADADKIEVKLFENEMGGLEKLIVRARLLVVRVSEIGVLPRA